MKDLIREMTKNVATNIRKVREHKRYTQDYLATKLGISQNAYSKIELGYSKISIDRLFNIAILLEVEATVLLTTEAKDIIQRISRKK
ncbi:helix-turn-helix domain-containing protein [Pedobacter deserti]|uniref:helix-turn-helix domain-containing protein n=1 Tax=Pedobacter deserti TaxID=2817382 RepID=UPI00210D60E2|nr:helix-turn-helix transcriptional regulator [Pedobacter sp. SYSU D00382]